MDRLDFSGFSRRFEGLVSRPPFRPRPTVGVLRLAGVIGGHGIARGVGLSAERLEAAIARAFRGRGMVAVALAINSPGGSAVQSALIANRIRAAAAERKVPVIAFAEDVAASGGYWLACAADEIYADAASIVGSIGVIAAGFGFQDLLARHGIERRVHTAGAHKGMLDPFRPEAAEDVARLRAIQDDVHAQFKDMVRARRGDRLKGEEAELFGGAFWSGREALALGLIDGIGDLRGVMRERFGEKVRFREVGARRGLLRRRLGFGGALQPDLAEAAAELLPALDAWALWKRYGL
jgi:signal peptide peptidase SppA